MPRTQTLLPIVPFPTPGESLDGYLERLATVNGYDRADLARLLGASPTNPLGAIPIDISRTMRDRVIALTGLSAAQITAMTVRGLGQGSPYKLATVDAGNPRTLQSARARGWFPPKGSPICPKCLTETGMWQLLWRIPFCTICPIHETYLISKCPSCRRMPRTVRASVFKGWMDDPAACGNPTGSKTPCSQDLRHTQAPVATDKSAVVGRKVWSALSGRPMMSVNTDVRPNVYIRDLKEISIVILSLASATPSSSISQSLLEGEESKSLEHRRWTSAPPRDLTGD
ncbi:TniQ family protein [Brevibacterium picturae]|uniref:TniQ family protein n=1 Tax=Brevibacterium picturae TaxID=260553 RepID=UPI003D1551E4